MIDVGVCILEVGGASLWNQMEAMMEAMMAMNLIDLWFQMPHPRHLSKKMPLSGQKQRDYKKEIGTAVVPGSSVSHDSNLYLWQEATIAES